MKNTKPGCHDVGTALTTELCLFSCCFGAGGGIWAVNRLQKHSATELYTPGPFEELLICKLSQWHRRAKQEATREVSKCFPYHRHGLTDDNERKLMCSPTHGASVHGYGRWRASLWRVLGKESNREQEPHLIPLSLAHKRYTVSSRKHGFSGEGLAILLES